MPLTTGKVRPLPEERKKDQPITLEAFYAGKLPNLYGTPVANLTWLDDGEHFLQVKEKKLYKVHAATGKATLFVDPAALTKSLADVPDLDKKAAEGIAASTRFDMNPPAHRGPPQSRKRPLLPPLRRRQGRPAHEVARRQGAGGVQP